MALSTFTQSDINRLVYYLKLPPIERRSNSELYYRLRWVEEEDQRNGTTVAATIQGYLDKLDEMETAINTELETGSGGVEGVSKGVDGMYSQSLSYGSITENGGLPQNKGKSDRMRDLILDIKRELYYLRFDNQIPLDSDAYPYGAEEYSIRYLTLLDS